MQLHKARKNFTKLQQLHSLTKFCSTSTICIPWLNMAALAPYDDLKGHDNETDFLGFLQKSVPHESLTLPFEQFRFWLQIRGDICIRKTTPHYHWYRELPTPRITNMRSPNSLHHWYAESATPRITYTESQLLNFFKENSLYQSPTPRITDTESRWLRISLSQGVDDSEDWWYGESLFKEKLIWCQFSELLTAKPCL